MKSRTLAWIAVAISLVLVVLVLRSVASSQETTMPSTSAPFTSPSGRPRKSGKKMLPVSRADHNDREMCKQMILLEDHLLHEEKRCPDCIRKHFLCIEGLAEEARSLKGGDRRDYDSLADRIRVLEKDFASGQRDPVDIAQDIRVIRKPMSKECFDKFE